MKVPIAVALILLTFCLTIVVMRSNWHYGPLPGTRWAVDVIGIKRPVGHTTPLIEFGRSDVHLGGMCNDIHTAYTSTFGSVTVTRWGGTRPMLCSYAAYNTKAKFNDAELEEFFYQPLQLKMLSPQSLELISKGGEVARLHRVN